MTSQTNRIFGGVLLIAGTTVGAGMLAMPISTGLAGFYPSLVLFLIYWVYMTYTAFLFLEVNLWMAGDINLITMASKTLGIGGKVVAWVFYLFLLYALTTAYIAAGGPIFVDFIRSVTTLSLPQWLGSIPLLFIFGYFVFRGTSSVDIVNRILMCGLIIAYIALVSLLAPHIHPEYLKRAEWQYIPLAVSLVATSFGFHIIIPSLTAYLNHDISSLIKTLLIGSFFPVIIYVLWEFVMLGNLLIDGPHGVTSAFISGVSGASLIVEIFANVPWVHFAIKSLAFFVIITSFLGVSLSLLDFLADGTGIEKTRTGRLFLILLTFAPPLLFVLIYPRAFFTALEYAGAFGVVILLGLLPALMVWRGRYHLNYAYTFRTPGGKPALLGVIFFSIIVVLIEVGNKFGWIHL